MENKRIEVNELGEFGLIEHLTKNIEIQNASTIVGVGDDAAIIDHFGKQTVITTDILIENIHFDLIYTPLNYLGYKAVVVNISDIYAMNAIPTQITVSIAFSNKFSVEALSLFYDGVYKACADYNIDLVGGDTSTSNKGLFISITAIGEVTPNHFVQRNTAQINDIICVTGDLGAAFLGLTLLEREKLIYLENPTAVPDYGNNSYILKRFLQPIPQKNIIEYFATNNILPTSMIDISDGLSSEILHICTKSNVGCRIYENKIPINKYTKEAALTFGFDPTVCALNGGEDYELLFTIKQTDYEKIKENPHIQAVGYICKVEDGIKMISKANKEYNITAQGWNSFKT